MTGADLETEICIYGGNAAGVIAAYTAAKMNKKVILIEPGKRLGGLTTGGLGYTDIGNKYAINGLSLDVYRRIGKHYGKFEQWIFEPSVAEDVMKQYIKEAGVEVIYGYEVQKVEKEGSKISHITVTSQDGSPRTVKAGVFLDCSYEGDLLARAGVSFTVGREANALYKETYNGVQVLEGHQFPDGVDPYKTPGDASSGLVWGVSDAKLEERGAGDKKVQAYNFRICLSNKPENRVEITRPDNYDSTRYELLLRYLQKKIPGDLWGFLKFDLMPNGKTDINNNGPISTDMIGFNHNYPEADYATRRRIQKEHEDYTKGLLYFIGHDSRMPEHLRKQMLQWGYPKDEYTENGNWTPQMYVREARRMIGAYVMTQHNCEGREVVDDAVGLAAYTMDSHNCQRIVVNGMVKNEGNVEIGGFGPYPISYRAIIPKQGEADNLLVPVCLSASHIAYGSIRMEPVFMVLGQSCATAASLAIDSGKAVQEVDYALLRSRLEQDGQVLSVSAPAVPDSPTTPVLKLVEVRKIWDAAPHNAFTDLVRHRGKLLCAFRESGGHVPADHSQDGKIRILESMDGTTWTSAALVEREGIDLRDPKLSVTPDGRIMLLVAGSVYENRKFIGRKCYVSFSDDPREFRNLTPVEIDPKVSDETDWLWRVTWHANTAWGVMYNKGRSGSPLHLLSSTDGIRYKLVTSLDLKDFPNECSVVFEPDGAMVIVARRDAGDRMGMIGRAAPPYTDWKWNRMNTALGGPALCRLVRGTLLLATREPARTPKTVVGSVSLDGTFTKLLDLPSAGDTSYPGLVLEERTLWMSYYSSHEGKSSIYLARIAIK